jgi:hypothetical protein
MSFAVTPDALDALASHFRNIGAPLHSGHPSVSSLSAPDLVLQAIGTANRHLVDGLDRVGLDIDALALDLTGSADRYRTNEAELVAATGSPKSGTSAGGTPTAGKTP